jgi:hypothetical protein
MERAGCCALVRCVQQGGAAPGEQGRRQQARGCGPLPTPFQTVDFSPFSPPPSASPAAASRFAHLARSDTPRTRCAVVPITPCPRGAPQRRRACTSCALRSARRAQPARARGALTLRCAWRTSHRCAGGCAGGAAGWVGGVWVQLPVARAARGLCACARRGGSAAPRRGAAHAAAHAHGAATRATPPPHGSCRQPRAHTHARRAAPR